MPTHDPNDIVGSILGLNQPDPQQPQFGPRVTERLRLQQEEEEEGQVVDVVSQILARSEEPLDGPSIPQAHALLGSARAQDIQTRQGDLPEERTDIMAPRTDLVAQRQDVVQQRVDQERAEVESFEGMGRLGHMAGAFAEGHANVPILGLPTRGADRLVGLARDVAHGRELGSSDTPLAQRRELLERGAQQSNLGIVGEVLGTLGGGVAGIMGVRAVAGAVGNLASAGSQVDRALRALSTGRGATRATGAAIGVAEGLPLDIAFYLKDVNDEDHNAMWWLGAGVTIGAVSGALLPGSSKFARELQRAARDNPDQVARRIADLVDQGDKRTMHPSVLDVFRRVAPGSSDRKVQEALGAVRAVEEGLGPQIGTVRAAAESAPDLPTIARTIDPETGLPASVARFTRTPEHVEEALGQLRGRVPEEARRTATEVQVRRWTEGLDDDPDAVITEVARRMRDKASRPVVQGGSTVRPKEVPGEVLPDRNVADQIAETHQGGGSTIDIRTGQSMAGQPAFSVAVDPAMRRTQREAPTAADVERYIANNADHLTEGRTVGTWVDEDTGHHVLDVVELVHGRADALARGAARHQEAVFDLFNFADVRVPRAALGREYGISARQGRQADLDRLRVAQSDPSLTAAQRRRARLKADELADDLRASAPLIRVGASDDVNASLGRYFGNEGAEGMDGSNIRGTLAKLEEAAQSDPRAGAVNPALVRSLASFGAGAVGGSVGALLGPEPKITNIASAAAVAGVAGFAFSGPGTIRAIQRQLGRVPATDRLHERVRDVVTDRAHGVPEGVRPEVDVRTAERNRVRQIQATQNRAMKAWASLRRAVAGDFADELGPVRARGLRHDVLEMPEDLSQRLNRALYDQEARADMPEATRQALGRMRAHIDELSRTLKDENLVPWEMQATIGENMGLYLNRSYKAFDDPSQWYQQLRSGNEDVWNRAVRHIQEELDMDAGEAQRFAADLVKGQPGATDQMLGAMFRPKSGQSVLKKREDLPKWLRDLWGEYDDVTVNYTKTVSKMANLIAYQRFQRELIDAGEGRWMHHVTERPAPADDLHFGSPVLGGERETGFSVAQVLRNREAQMEPTTELSESAMRALGNIAPEDLNPIEGFVTTREITNMIGGMYRPQQMEGFMRAAYGSAAFAKWAKTVGNPVTHVRNWTGNLSFAVMNGDIRFRSVARAAAKGELGEQGRFVRAMTKVSMGQDGEVMLRNGMFSDELFDEVLQSDRVWERLAAAGVFSQSAREGDIRKMMEKVMRSGIEDLQDPSGDFAKRLLKRPIELGNMMYRVEDDFWKASAFYSQANQYARALGKTTPDGRPDIMDDEVFDLATSIVRETYPTYDRAAQIVQDLGTNPLVGPFVTFWSETYRTLVGTWRLSKREMASDNEAIRQIGRRRRNGMYFMASAPFAMQSGLMAAYGITREDMNTLQNHVVAPWSQNALLLPISGVSDDGDVRLLDMSYTEPHGYLRNTFVSMAFRGGGFDERLLRGMMEGLRPMFGEEIFAQHAREAVVGRSREGHTIWDREMSEVDIAVRIFSHLFDGIKPGVLQSANRFENLARGVPRESGRELDWREEASAHILGIRPTVYNIPQSFEFRTRDYNKRAGASLRNFNMTESRAVAALEQDLEPRAHRYISQMERHAQQYDRWVGEIASSAKAMVRMGMSVEAAEQIMKDAGVPNYRIDEVFEEWH